jgi:cytoskeletal protein CcmA (bactofilin family)
MAIFGKKPESSFPQQAGAPPSPPPAPRPRSTPAPPAVSAKRSFLGPGCVLEGDFKGAGSFECRGTFNGTIDIEEDLVIGQGGVATAQLKARRITIEGRLEGDATGSEKVEVGASGHVEGDVRAPAVQFAEGAFFEGNVEMRRAHAKEAGDDAERRPAAPTDAPAGASGQ